RRRRRRDPRLVGAGPRRPARDQGALMATLTNGDQRRITRRDARIEVAWNVACEKTVEIEQDLAEPLEQVYERVHADPADKGKRFAATLRDLSVNGAFLEAEPLPLLSRVVMVIDMPSFREVGA